MKTAETLIHEFGTVLMPEEDVLGSDAPITKTPKMVKVSVLTADDVRLILLEGYRAGMEAAARMCDEKGTLPEYHPPSGWFACASVIRAAAKTAQLPQ